MGGFTRTLGPGLALGLLLTNLAWAQNPNLEPSEAELDRAREHLDAGNAHAWGEDGDPEGYQRCAQAYLELYATYPESEHAPMMLASAAQCLDDSHELERAIETWTTLIERFGASDEAEDALHRLARRQREGVAFEAAARRYEQYAQTYPTAERAEGALENAYLLRLGLGQLDEARVDLSKWEAMYTGRDVEQAAEVFWTGRTLARSRAERRAHALAYLDRYGREGGLDRAVVAEFVIAEIDWQRSCREALLHDACLSVEREYRHPSALVFEAVHARLLAESAGSMLAAPPRFRRPERCTSAPKPMIVRVHGRRTQLAARAQARLERVLARVGDGEEIEIPSSDAQRRADFEYAWAMAMVYRADVELEEFLALDLPAGLDFHIERPGGFGSRKPPRPADLARVNASWRRFDDYFNAKVQLADSLFRRYKQVKDSESPRGILVAVSRGGLLNQSFADQLNGARVPRALWSEAQVESYCGNLARKVRGYAGSARYYWGDCLERATKLQDFSGFSRMCEAELAQHLPFKFPLTVELFGEGRATRSRIERVGLVDDRERLRLQGVVE